MYYKLFDNFIGQDPTNVAFGGEDGKTMYVTLQDRGCIETFRVETAGRTWATRNPDNSDNSGSTLCMLALSLIGLAWFA